MSARNYGPLPDGHIGRLEIAARLGLSPTATAWRLQNGKVPNAFKLPDGRWALAASQVLVPGKLPGGRRGALPEGFVSPDAFGERLGLTGSAIGYRLAAGEISGAIRLGDNRWAIPCDATAPGRRRSRSRRGAPRWTAEEDAWLLEHKDVHSLQVLGEQLGRSARSVQCRLQLVHGVKKRYISGPLRGVRPRRREDA